VTPEVPDPVAPKKAKLPGWLAVLPGLLLVTVLAVRAFVQVGMASKAISGTDASKPSKSLSCVETYGVTLANSEFYVPEGQQFTPRRTTEISTVVSGMVRNDCGEFLKSVTIPIQVRDDAGKRGDGSVTVSELNPGEAKLFSKAWMGRVTSYEIGKIR
jgi:hypothetical protein